MNPNRMLLKLMEWMPIIILVVLFVLFSIMAPRFLSWENIENIFRQSSYIGILAVGMTFVLLTAGVDLSVGAIMYLTATVMGYVLNDLSMGVLVAIAAGLLTGALVGGVNAFAITKLKVTAFIVTLATLSIIRGVSFAFTKSRDITYTDAIIAIDSYRIFGLPAPLLIFACVVIVGQIILSQTGYGRQILAVGQDVDAARKAGLPVGHILASVYVICGVTAALACIISISQLGVVNAGFGDKIEFNAIAAAVLGGASLFGGRGSIFPGAVIGAVLIQTIASGLVYIDVDIYFQPIVTAMIIFLAVLLDSLRTQKMQQLQRKHIRVEE